ncbi:uncharacterized protein LOC134686550 [Mytilus trossulus]|uniref:uncharacterized protein LOC134686550 n=1 Tax=Mytilus trossulus TaxID=6551 RepID=UPI0030057027
MGTGFLIFLFLFVIIFLLQIVGFSSPYWDIKCEKNYDSDINNSNNETCFYQGLFYGCDINGNCRLTNIIDSRVFGLAVGIITGNVIVLVLLILVLAHVSENNKKSMKTGALLLFTATEILNIASTIIVWMDSYDVGWSWWVTSWSAVVLIAIIALTCLCALLVAEDRENNNYNHYCVCQYVLID